MYRKIRGGKGGGGQEFIENVMNQLLRIRAVILVHSLQIKSR